MQVANKRQHSHIINFSGLAFALFSVLYLSLGTPLRELLPTGGQVQQKTNSSRPLSAPTSDNATKPDRRMGVQLIESIRLMPTQPTRLDTLRAEIIPAVNDTSRLTYIYAWKVNDRIIKNATGDALELSNYKKRDLVYVTPSHLMMETKPALP